MRNEPRANAALDEAIDAVLRDMMAEEAPAMLKARVLARLGDELIDATLRDIAAREVPPALRARVLTRLDEEPAGSNRARGERWTLSQALWRPACGLAAAGLVAATGLTVWLFSTPPVPAPGGERVGQVASRPDGSTGRAVAGTGPRAQSGGGISGQAPSSSGTTSSAVATRASRSVTRPKTTQLARHTATRFGAESEDAVSGADDPLAIKPLRVDSLSVHTIAIPPIEVAPVEILPPMSDTTANPPGEPGAESRTGG